MHASTTSRIRRLYWFYAFQNALFGVPVLVLYMQERGVNLHQFFLLQSFYSVATLFLEVPSGYLSDRWMRRHVLSLASLFAGIGTVLYALGDGFYDFLIAESFYALGSSFLSGTMEAIVHDTLQEQGEQKHSRSVMYTLFSILMLMQSATALLTGFIAAWSLQLAVLARLPFMLIASVMTFFLYEPVRIKLSGGSHLVIIKDVCAHVIFRNAALRGIIVMCSVIGTITLALLWLTQSYQNEVRLPLQIFGIVQAAMLAGGALFARSIKALERAMDDRLLFILMGFTAVVACVLLALPYSLWGFGVLFLGRSVYGGLMPLTTDLINHMTSSNVRATILSIRAFAMRLVFAAAGPIIGYASDTFSLRETFLFMGIAAAICLIAVFLSIRHVWAQIPDTRGN